MSLAEFLYSRLRQHESFDFGEWDELTPGQRAYVDGAAAALLRELQRRYRAHPKLRGNWLEEAKQCGLFDDVANLNTEGE